MEHEIVRSVAAAQEEIMAFAQELGQYGLRMTDISENCPKQERTLAVCHRVLSCAREYPAYLEQLIMKHSGGFKSFTKVTSPLGSSAVRRVGSSPTTRTSDRPAFCDKNAGRLLLLLQ